MTALGTRTGLSLVTAIREDIIPGRHDGGESGWHTAQSVPRFLGSRRPGSTVVALLTDSAMRGFAISFFTSRRIASLNALLLFSRGMTPSSCHAPKAGNGQFRPDEEILEMHSCRSNGRPCAGKSAQEPRRSHSCRKMLRRESAAVLERISQRKAYHYSGKNA